MKYLGTFLLISLVLILLNSQSIKETNTIIVTDTAYTTKTITKYKKGDSIPFVILDTIYNTIHDTNYIVKDYSHFKAYSDTLNIDSSTIIINDTIGENRLVSRAYEANIKERTITITNTIPEKNRFYIGGVANFNYIGAGVIYKTSKQLIGVSYNSDKSINLSYYVRIF